MPTIAIVNEKGGTAKTTTAVNLSAAFGSLGRRVLLVDLDGQAAASRWLGVEEDNRLSEAMLNGGSLEPIENVAPGVSLAPATGKLDSVAHDLRPSQGGQLRKILKQIQDRYDLVLLDCPPSLGNRLIGNALLAATHALVPVETSILALDGLKILLTTLEDIRDGFGHDIVLAGVLACRYDGRTRLSRLVLDELCRALPGKVFETVIRENVRMRECPASGQSILSFAPESHAAEDYLALAREMIARPHAWQQPAAWARDDEGAEVPQAERCSIGELRSNAAASVRAAARKPSAAKDEAEDAAQTPAEATPAAAALGTSPKPTDPPFGGPEPSAGSGAGKPPAETGLPVAAPAAGMAAAALSPSAGPPDRPAPMFRADPTLKGTAPSASTQTFHSEPAKWKDQPAPGRIAPPVPLGAPSNGGTSTGSTPQSVELKPLQSASTAPPGQAKPPSKDLATCLDRLAKAEGRLLAEEGDRPPALGDAPAEPKPSLSASTLTQAGSPARPFSTQPKPPAAGSPVASAPPEKPQPAAGGHSAAVRRPDETPGPAETHRVEEETALMRLLQQKQAAAESALPKPAGADDAFPALRAYLRQIRHGEDAPKDPPPSDAETKPVETAADK